MNSIDYSYRDPNLQRYLTHPSDVEWTCNDIASYLAESNRTSFAVISEDPDSVLNGYLESLGRIPPYIKEASRRVAALVIRSAIMGHAHGTTSIDTEPRDQASFESVSKQCDPTYCAWEKDVHETFKPKTQMYANTQHWCGHRDVANEGRKYFLNLAAKMWAAGHEGPRIVPEPPKLEACEQEQADQKQEVKA